MMKAYKRFIESLARILSRNVPRPAEPLPLAVEFSARGKLRVDGVVCAYVIDWSSGRGHLIKWDPPEAPLINPDYASGQFTMLAHDDGEELDIGRMWSDKTEFSLETMDGRLVATGCVIRAFEEAGLAGGGMLINCNYVGTAVDDSVTS